MIPPLLRWELGALLRRNPVPKLRLLSVELACLGCVAEDPTATTAAVGLIGFLLLVGERVSHVVGGVWRVTCGVWRRR